MQDNGVSEPAIESAQSNPERNCAGLYTQREAARARDGINGTTQSREGPTELKENRKHDTKNECLQCSKIYHLSWHCPVVPNRAALVIVLARQRRMPALLMARRRLWVRHRKRNRRAKDGDAHCANQQAGKHFLFHSKYQRM